MAEVPASQQHVLVDAKVLVSRSAFVGHSFLPEDQDIVSYVKDLLREMQINCITGERAEASEIHAKVKRRILDAEYFVGIFTRRHKIEDKQLWTTTEWVVQELAFAAANKKKLIILREEGLIDFAGLQGNLEYIEFNRETLHLASIKLLQTLWSLNPSRMQIGSDKSLMQADALKIAVEANPEEPMLRVALAGALRAKGLLKAALDTIDEVLAVSPELPSAIVTKAQILRSKGHHSEAKEILYSLAETYPSDGNILHELAHLLAEQGDTTGAEKAFERAADCQPTLVRHLDCLANLLIRTGSRRESKLRKAADICNEIKRVGNASQQANAEKLLEAIRSRMERLSNNSQRKVKKTERPK